VREDLDPPVGVDVGLATLAVALAGRKSIQQGRPVAVSEILTTTTGVGTDEPVSISAGTTR
jgi:hypothetical protein